MRRNPNYRRDPEGDERETEPNIPETALTSDTAPSSLPKMNPPAPPKPPRPNRWVVTWHDDKECAATLHQEADAHFLQQALTAIGFNSTLTPYVFLPMADLL